MEIQKLSLQQFKKMAKLVYDRTGIHMPEEKISMLSNRLRRRLKALSLDSFDAYYKFLSSPKGCDEELPNFLSAVTTNETYFFRNEQLWKFIQDDLIKHWVETKTQGAKSIRIWSSASSSGEEAYTAAIVLREHLPKFDDWSITIVGSDISKKVLDKASAAIYNDYAVAKMSKAQVRRWFTKKDDDFQLVDDVRKMVRFQSHNLRDPFPSGRFDLVFLRNVLMYFDTPMKKTVITNVSNAVAPGGHMIVGDVDPIRTIAELSACMTLDYQRPGVYHKPTGRKAEEKTKKLVTM
ncbi:MAG: CheR family methyltransferase [Phycisphaerae bacterium]